MDSLISALTLSYLLPVAAHVFLFLPLTNPSMVAPSRIFLNTKTTNVFMYFSLLSGKDTLYSIFFDSPENIVSSTILSLLLYTRTTGTNNSISRAIFSGSLTLLYVLFFFSIKQENKTVHFFLPFSSVLF